MLFPQPLPQAQSDGLPVATLQRYQLLQAAVDMLPPGVQSAHAEALLQRQYQEHLEPNVLKQVCQGWLKAWLHC